MDIEAINGIPLISIKENALTGFNNTLKRAADVSLAGLAIILGAPLWLALAAAIRLDSPGPVLFRQERAGRYGKPFQVYKFRSMHQNAEAQLEKLRAQNEAAGPLFKIRDDPRRTRVGRFIRKLSLDEIPQLINVLRGEMSWVGPRPGLLSEVARVSRLAPQTAGGAAGHHGLVAGQRPQRFDVR